MKKLFVLIALILAFCAMPLMAASGTSAPGGAIASGSFVAQPQPIPLQAATSGRTETPMVLISVSAPGLESEVARIAGAVSFIRTTILLFILVLFVTIGSAVFILIRSLREDQNLDHVSARDGIKPTTATDASIASVPPAPAQG